MILDKLLEKKDIQAYIHYRIKTLEATMASEIKHQPIKHREFIRGKFSGRIKELEMLSHHLKHDIKLQSKRMADNLK